MVFIKALILKDYYLSDILLFFVEFWIAIAQTADHFICSRECLWLRLAAAAEILASFDIVTQTLYCN